MKLICKTGFSLPRCTSANHGCWTERILRHPRNFSRGGVCEAYLRHPMIRLHHKRASPRVSRNGHYRTSNFQSPTSVGRAWSSNASTQAPKTKVLRRVHGRWESVRWPVKKIQRRAAHHVQKSRNRRTMKIAPGDRQQWRYATQSSNQLS